MDLEFSKCFAHTSALDCRWSPSGRYLASASKYQLIVRDENLEILHIFACQEIVEEMHWSPDSQSLLCLSLSKNVVEVFSLLDTEWRAAIDEESLLPGVTAVRWAPDSKHLIIVSDFQLFVAVWSLATGSEVQYVKHPKYSWSSVLDTPEREGKEVDGRRQEDDDTGIRGLHFSHRGRYMAVAQREGCKDFIAIYDCAKQWMLAKRIAVETQDLGDFAWSADDRSLCVWESSHMPYKVMFYPLSASSTTTTAAAPQKKSFSAYKDQLSIKTVAWSPDTQYIAVGSYDQTVRLINSRTWKVEMECKHTPAATRSKETTVFREIDRPWADGRGSEDEEPRPEAEGVRSTIYGVNDDPVEFKSVRVDPLKANPELGIGMLSWSHDSSHFFTRSDNVPNMLWVWDAVKMSLVALLVQKHPIKSARWHPTQTRLALCTASRVVYLWSPSACLSCDLPKDTKLHVRDIVWNPSGGSLLLVDRKAFSACYFPASA